MAHKLEDFSKGDLVSFRNDNAFGIVNEIDGWKDGRLMIEIAADKATNSNPCKLVHFEGVKIIVKNYRSNHHES